MTNDIYKSGDAEAILLRACRPYGTLMALLILGYAAVGMPLPNDAPAQFAVLFCQFMAPLSIGAVGVLGAVWMGGHGAPKMRLSARWVAINAGVSVITMVLLMAWALIAI
ncbi:MAG: hypothetical protein ACYC4K_04060 [Thiobacillus sp.]